jgi:hypothetical protein
MPCYRCGTRQVDPDRGESPWQRGVRGDRQVLICPGCQASFDWTADLDRCAVCASARLMRRLGEVECRECGSVGQPVPAAGVREAALAASEVGAADMGAGVAVDDPGAGGDASAGLAAEVEEALARVLGPARSQPPPFAMS